MFPGSLEPRTWVPINTFSPAQKSIRVQEKRRFVEFKMWTQCIVFTIQFKMTDFLSQASFDLNSVLFNTFKVFKKVYWV